VQTKAETNLSDSTSTVYFHIWCKGTFLFPQNSFTELISYDKNSTPKNKIRTTDYHKK